MNREKYKDLRRRAEGRGMRVGLHGAYEKDGRFVHMDQLEWYLDNFHLVRNIQRNSSSKREHD